MPAANNKISSKKNSPCKNVISVAISNHNGFFTFHRPKNMPKKTTKRKTKKETKVHRIRIKSLLFLPWGAHHFFVRCMMITAPLNMWLAITLSVNLYSGFSLCLFHAFFSVFSPEARNAQSTLNVRALAPVRKKLFLWLAYFL